MTSREEEKRAANEATFRDANERIRATEQELDPPLERVPYLCECDDVECRGLMRLTALEYERVRLVVRKAAAGGQVARALDPRGEDAHERRAG